MYKKNVKILKIRNKKHTKVGKAKKKKKQQQKVRFVPKTSF
jgi:hypothetical protein